MSENEFDKNIKATTPEEEVTVVEKAVNEHNEVEITPNDFKGYIYVKTPQVGHSIELEISKVFKADSRKLINSVTNKPFWTGLEDKNGKRTETILETVNGERYTIDSWGLYFQLFGKECDFQKLANKNGSYDGIKIKITHNWNGKDSGSKPEDIMKIRGFETLEEAKEHIAKVAKAMADGTLYTVEVLNDLNK